MKVNSTIYKGIEFVDISALPMEQKTSILLTVNPDLFIKILVDEKLALRCLQYKDYEEWYTNSYLSLNSTRKDTKSVPQSRDEKVKAELHA